MKRHTRRSHRRKTKYGWVWVRQAMVKPREKATVIKFMTVDKSGRQGPIREIDKDDILKCPHVIMVADHYRTDGSCRCNDSTHFEMAEWGYMWDGSLWQSMPEEDGDA